MIHEHSEMEGGKDQSRFLKTAGGPVNLDGLVCMFCIWWFWRYGRTIENHVAMFNLKDIENFPATSGFGVLKTHNM